MAAYWPISALSVSEKLVYRFRFFALYCLAYFSNTRFTLPFASRVANAPILVSLRLGSGVVGLKYWRIPVLVLKKKKNKKKNKKKSFWKTMELILPPLHCCYTTQGRKHPLPLLLLEQLANSSTSTCPLTTPTKNHTYQEPPPQI